MRKLVTDQSGNKYYLTDHLISHKATGVDGPTFDRYEDMASDVCHLTVREYFKKYLEADLLGHDQESGPDPNGLDMPIATPCGFACKLAIDAAREFNEFCKNAGTDCIELARDAVKVLIFG